MPKLVIEKGPNKGETFTITSQIQSIIIGRESTAQLRLADTMTSRLHFKVEARKDGFYLVDMDSMNGTFVNGQRVKDKLLKLGDMIQVGETLISFIGDKIDRKDDRAGEIVGGYKIIERVGRGGMGTVYRATQISLNRIVALKLLSEEMVKDKTFVNLFFDEARSAAQLNHPHIVQVYDVGRTSNEIYYFSMEYLSGGSVQELLSKEKKLPPVKAVKIVLDAAKGLEYAERKGIVHRDIKPDNLMIAEDGTIKICDLGLAKSLKTPSRGEVEGSILGTPHYLAPEQAQGKTVDHRADIYALGATFYRILAGVTPYSGSSIKEIILKKLKEEPPPLKKVAPTIPDEIVGIVEKMMRRKQEERYQSATVIIPELTNIITASETPPEKRRIAKSETTGTTKPSSKTIPLVATAAVIIILAIVGVIFKDKLFGKKPPSTGTVNPGSNPGLIELQEKLARQYIQKAEEFEQNQMSPDDPASVQKAISLYESVIKECPKSTLVNRAEGSISRLKKNIEQIAQQANKQKYELEAKNTLQAINSAADQKFSGIVSTINISEIAGFIENALEELSQFEEKYPNTSATESARQRKNEWEKWQERFQNAAEQYSKIEELVKKSIQRKHFELAFEAINKFIDNPAYKDTLYDKIANGLIKSTEREAESAMAELMRQVDNMVNSESLEEANNILKSARDTYGLPHLETQINNKLKSVKRLLDNQIIKQQAEASKQDEEKFLAIFIANLWALQTGQFKNINLSSAQGLFITTEFQQRWKDFSEEIELERNILQEWMERLNTGALNNRLYRNKYLRHADEKGIESAIDNKPDSKGGSMLFKWEDITASEWLALIGQGWSLSPYNQLGLGVLCLKRGGLVKEAKDQCLKYAIAISDKNTELLANKYFNEARDRAKNREKEAEKILTQGESFFTANKKPEARITFLLLKYRYGTTSFYLKNEVAIKDYINKTR